MQVYLHIGLHKTATTFLQNQVFPHLGIPYVRTGGSLVRSIAWQQDWAFDPDAARAELLAGVPADATSVLISSEDLSGAPFVGYVNRAQALDRLKVMFPEARIVVGIRSQRSLLWSLYKHYVSHGGTRSLRGAIAQEGHPGAGWVDLDSLRFGPYLASIADRFGEGSMKVLVYERLLEDPEAYVADIVEHLGTSVQAPITYKTVNSASLGDGEVLARRRLNRVLLNRGHSQGFLPAPKPLQRTLIKVLQPFSRGLPDKITLAALDGSFNEDNRAMDQRFDLGLESEPALAAKWFPTGSAGPA